MRIKNWFLSGSNACVSHPDLQRDAHESCHVWSVQYEHLRRNAVMMWWWCGGPATSYPDEVLGSTPQTWLNGLALSHVKHLTLVGRAKNTLVLCRVYSAYDKTPDGICCCNRQFPMFQQCSLSRGKFQLICMKESRTQSDSYFTTNSSALLHNTMWIRNGHQHVIWAPKIQAPN